MQVQNKGPIGSRRRFLSAVGAAAAAATVAGCGGGGSSASGFPLPLDPGGQTPPPAPPPSPPPPAPPPPAQAIGRWGEAKIVAPDLANQSAAPSELVKTSAAGRFSAVAWLQGSQIWVRTHETGTGWRDAFNAWPDPIPATIYALRLAQHASGHLALAWVSGDSELRQHVHLAIAGAGRSPTPVRVSEDAAEIKSLALAVDEKGTAIVAWGVQQNFPQTARTVWTAAMPLDGDVQDGARLPLPDDHDCPAFALSIGGAPQVALAMQLRETGVSRDVACVVHGFDSSARAWGTAQEVERQTDGKKTTAMCMAYADGAYSLASLRRAGEGAAHEIRSYIGGRTGWSAPASIQALPGVSFETLDLAAATGGRTALAWTQYDQNAEAMYATGKDILSLSPAIAIDRDTAKSNAFLGGVSVGTDVIGVWARDDGKQNFDVVVSAHDGDRWAPAAVVNRAKAALDSWPACAAGTDFAVVAWRQKRDDGSGLNDLWVVERTYASAN